MLKGLGAVAPLVGAIGISIALAGLAQAGVDAVAPDGPLSGSTSAIFLGGTAEPTPSIDYVDAAEKLYLDPLGFSGATSVCDMVGTTPCDAPLQVLTTPELFEFGPSSLLDETDIVNAVEAEHAAGDFSASDPLTVFAYSQSAIAASAAETVLAKDGILPDELHFVFIGDPSDADGIATNIYGDIIQLFGGGANGVNLTSDLLTATNEDQFAPGGSLVGLTPDDLYQTTVYTIGRPIGTRASTPPVAAPSTPC